MKLAVAQVAPVLGELQANLDRSRELIAQAVAKGAELIVFPELNLSGYLTRNQLALTANDPRLRASGYRRRRRCRRASRFPRSRQRRHL